MPTLIIERDEERCLHLSTRLHRTQIVHGDGTDIALLRAEHVGAHDAFVAVTREDETNLLSTLLANGLGARKTIAKVRRGDYEGVVDRLHLSAVINPLTMAANAILSFVRPGRVLTVSLLESLQAEAFEMIAEGDAPITYRRLGEGLLPRGAIVGAILRGPRVIIPRGTDEIRPQDRVIVICLETVVRDVERLFTGAESVKAR